MKKTFMIIISAILVILDQVVKYYTRVKLSKEPLVIWSGVFELTFVKNTGAAFGIMKGQKVFFLILTAFFLILAFYLIIKTPLKKRFAGAFTALILLLSGTVGNAVDRLYFGYVTDMFYFKLIDFPVFNVADCYITVAVFLSAILVLFVYDDEEVSLIYGRKNS